MPFLTRKRKVMYVYEIMQKSLLASMGVITCNIGINHCCIAELETGFLIALLSNIVLCVLCVDLSQSCTCVS